MPCLLGSVFAAFYQSLSIKIKIEKGHGDPLGRFIVPLCIDKAFFNTSRVAPLVEWTMAKNLDWVVEAGVGGDAKRDGGKQRLIARIIVCRKSYYCECFKKCVLASRSLSHALGTASITPRDLVPLLPDTLHYIIMAFSISTISFAAFTIHTDDIEVRSNIVLTVLLTVVAFNYVCQDKIPKVRTLRLPSKYPCLITAALLVRWRV